LARDGSIRWQSIDRERLQEGYRTVWTIRVPIDSTPSALAISGLDQDFLKSIGTTLLFTVISVSLELLIALFMAMTVNSAFRGRGLMRAVMLVPWAIPTVISARLWELMLKDTSAGIVNRVLMDLRIVDAPQAWLSAVSLQLPAAIMVDVWKTAPFMALLLLAGLQTIPSDLYEAAAVDGATRVQQFFSLTLPLLRPTIAVALVFRTLDALRVFDLFNVLFGRQQLSMATYNYETLVNNQQDGYASAVSMIIFVLISVFAIVYVRMLNVETE
jgi:trehalose/maltose transport system permease protein